ncbi:MAG: phosphatidate cytidylyltransferase, partial [Sphingomicrobium sp.]
VAACVFMSVGLHIDAVLLAVIGFAWVVVEVLFLGRTIHQAGVALFAPLYIGIPLGMLVAIQDTLEWQGTLLLIATVIVSDSAQYYSGRAFGRRPLAPTISPKKTVEGAIGGVVVGTAFMAIAGRWALPVVATLPLALAGLIVVVFGIGGDLFESRLKRVAGVKDSSTLIPGHGGVLDRIDALLFAAPAFYVFLQAS